MTSPVREGLDPALLRRFTEAVAERLDAENKAARREGRPPPTEQDRKVHSRHVLMQLLTAYAEERISRGEPPLDPMVEEDLAQAVKDALFGLGPLQRLVEDEEITDIDATGCNKTWITKADGTKVQGPPLAQSDAAFVSLIQLFGARLGLGERRFDEGSPFLDLELPDGSRLAATMSVTPRPILSVRRHRFPVATLDDLVRLGTVDDGLKALLQALVRARKNIIIGGETGAGKTTLARALINECPPHERLITIENSFELNIHRHPERHHDVVALQCRDPNAEGEGEVSMARLVRRTLRHNPDRVIVGEVLGDEVVPMLLAMSQGNDGSISTIHARSSEGVFNRIAMYAVLSPQRLRVDESAPLIAGGVDYVIFMDKVDESQLPGGVVRRFVSSIREVTGFEGAMVASNEIYRPGPDGRAVPGSPMRYLEHLMRVGYDPTWLEKPDGWWFQ